MNHLPLLTAARRSALAASALCLSLVLAACGGGGGSSSAGDTTATAQSASGTVTGFGSVFVDGVELEDANATVVAENLDGSFGPSALKLGQRVRVAHDGKGQASRVTVDAAVLGAVSNVDAANNAFQVAGQRVVVNTDSAAGPVTVYGGGYSALADVLASDLVEVHGSPVYNTVRASYDIQASRVEKRASITAVRVMGKLAGLDATAKTFGINGLSVNYAAATLVPATATLANDQVVAVWGPPGSLTTVGGTPTLAATRVRVMNAALADTVTAGAAQLGGLVSNYDATAKTLEIQGVKVNVAGATITPANKTLGNSSYVEVAGTFASDGTLVATRVRIREQDTVDDTARIRLNGAISALTDATSFVVRGVAVDASTATLAASCTGVTLATGVVVNVVATPQAGTDVVKAVSVACVGATALPAIVMREVGGNVVSADTTAKTLSLTVTSTCTACANPLTVQWSDQTAFEGVTAATLTGADIKVEGYLNASGVLVAREIHLNGSSDHDAYDKPPTSAVGLAKGWGKYRNRR